MFFLIFGFVVIGVCFIGWFMEFWIVCWYFLFFWKCWGWVFVLLDLELFVVLVIVVFLYVFLVSLWLVFFIFCICFCGRFVFMRNFIVLLFRWFIMFLNNLKDLSLYISNGFFCLWMVCCMEDFRLFILCRCFFYLLLIIFSMMFCLSVVLMVFFCEW